MDTVLPKRSRQEHRGEVSGRSSVTCPSHEGIPDTAEEALVAPMVCCFTAWNGMPPEMFDGIDLQPVNGQGTIGARSRWTWSNGIVSLMRKSPLCFGRIGEIRATTMYLAILLGPGYNYGLIAQFELSDRNKMSNLLGDTLAGPMLAANDNSV